MSIKIKEGMGIFQWKDTECESDYFQIIFQPKNQNFPYKIIVDKEIYMFFGSRYLG